MVKEKGSDTHTRRRQVLVAAIGVVLLLGMVVLLVMHGRQALAFFTDGASVQEQAARLGPLAPLVLGALVVLQEVTVVVPSEPLELAAGYAFGFWKGALIYLAASVVGCIAIIAIVRFGGSRVVNLFLSEKRQAKLARLRQSQKFDLALLAAFFIPGLPKDIMAYTAALAGMHPVKLVVVTTAGRLPSIAAAALASSFAAAGDWRATAVVFGVTAALVLVGTLAYHYLRRRRARGGEDSR